jgi:hypothetical protein
VLDHRSNQVLVTSQNHGFAVKPSEEGEATAVSLYDGTVEGFDFPDLRARSVQFHPEAGPGPHDGWPLLVNLLRRCPAALESVVIENFECVASLREGGWANRLHHCCVGLVTWPRIEKLRTRVATSPRRYAICRAPEIVKGSAPREQGCFALWYIDTQLRFAVHLRSYKSL